MRDYGKLGEQLLSRLDAVDLEEPRVDCRAAKGALQAHLRALGITGTQVRWVPSPDRFRRELSAHRRGAGSWHTVGRRRKRLLDGYHHLDGRIPRIPDRSLGVVGVDLALLLRTVGRDRTPRLVRVPTADLNSIARRMVDGTMTIRALGHLPAVEPLMRAVEAGVFAFGVDGDGSLVVAPRPRLRFDADGRIHDWDGNPAAEWEGGRSLYYWRGIDMTASAGRAPERLTPKRVLDWSNAERRRVAIERFGWEWFLDSAGFAEVQQDDYGRLLRTAREVDGEAVTLVQVVNATAEPDGTFNRYVLRVPPATRTAREAVAWTFQIDEPERYAPLVQS